MHRTYSSKPYDILHGIHFSANLSSIFAYLSYFPPPPPLVPAPPPQRSWTCSARSLSSSSCFVSDDLNPPSLRKYVPLIGNNQSLTTKNTSHISKVVHQNLKISPILQFLQNQITVIVPLIILFSIFIFVILFLLLFLYIQRTRRRQLTTNRHVDTDDNTTNNTLELNNNTNKNKKFYYHLIPYREKHERRPPTLRNVNDENNLSSSTTNHDLPALEVIRVTKSSGTHINDREEQEEAL